MLSRYGVFDFDGAAGEAAGDAFDAGLELVVGAFSTGATVGAAAAGVGLAAAGVVLVAGSAAHPAARSMEERVNARIAVRLITVILVIYLCLVLASW